MSHPQKNGLSTLRCFGLITAIAWLAGCAPEGEIEASESSQSDSNSDSDPDWEAPHTWLELLDGEAWSATPVAEDPWRAERPGEPTCPAELGWRAEAGGLEVDTGACDYLSVSQPLAVAITAGQPLRITAWWQNLIAPSPSQGHLALAIDGEVVWEEWVEIPGSADARDVEVAAPEDAEPGALITLHLHNHGANTWRFQGLALGLPAT